MNDRKGFIQILLLIAIIAGILGVSGASYVGVKQYQNYQVEKVEQQKILQEKEKEAQIATEAQQKALEVAQQEIEKLKINSAEAQKKQEILEQRVQSEQKKQQTLEKTIKKEAQNLQAQHISVISSADLSDYITGTVELVCWTNSINGAIKDKVSGSGSLWSFGSATEGYVLTNKHVAIGSQCLVDVDDTNGKLINYFGAKVIAGFIQNDKDFALLEISDIKDNEFSNIKTTELNYKISSLRFCPTQIAIGSPVVIIGYPASTQTESSVFVSGVGNQIVSNTPRTVTSGIISAYDNTSNNPYIGGLSKYQNYFISAKIDSGNSGGIAFSKDKDGLCILGIPTWLNVGNYDTQGLIQNIHNVMYQQ